MNRAEKYEYFAGLASGGKARWSRDFTKLQPLAAWPDNTGCVTMNYDAPLKNI
jgi:hypothetical protein